MDQPTQTCINCRIGTLSRKTATYAAWHGDQFVIAPAMPTWLCDVCGERTYDQFALDQLLLLIGPVSPLPDASDAVDAHRGLDPSSTTDTPPTRRRV